MTDRIKLTEANFKSEGGWFMIHVTKEVKYQILDDNARIDKITEFAKNLSNSNPHISYQLKKLLLTKTL